MPDRADDAAQACPGVPMAPDGGRAPRPRRCECPGPPDPTPGRADADDARRADAMLKKS